MSETSSAEARSDLRAVEWRDGSGPLAPEGVAGYRLRKWRISAKGPLSFSV